MNKRKKLPIGIESFEEMRKEDFYYVDKTRWIEQLLAQWGKVNLFTRPRWFGKSLNMSMLQTFFEVGADASLFDGLYISKNKEVCKQYLGKFPVVSISLKGVNGNTFDEARSCLVKVINREARRLQNLSESEKLTQVDKELFEKLLSQMKDDGTLSSSLLELSELLEKHYEEKVIVLIDEYDVPLAKANENGYYDEMVLLIRNLFENVLKTNHSLKFAVLTGSLRVAKESIFTGLNNLEVNSVLNDNFAEYFGFTPQEVENMLDFYNINEKSDEVKNWYDGYLFGNKEVYNPWSVINYVKIAVTNTVAFPKPYWSNTSSNTIVRELVENADEGVKGEIEKLIAGETIEKPVHEDITYEDVYRTQDNLWNFLFFTGYLKAVSQRMEGNIIYLTMAIPNEEVRYIYQNTIRDWFEQKQKKYNVSVLYEGLKSGECEQIESFINSQLTASISYYDDAERFYHGYMIGILSQMTGYEIQSNKEQGNGRPDILLKPFSPKQPAIILELKRAHKFIQMEELCDKALEQIEERKYDTELVDEGYQSILKYGICFCGKNCMVKTGKN